MSKNQIETYLCFHYKEEIKKISKLIVTKRGDIIVSLPYVDEVDGKTFIVRSRVLADKIYGSSGIKELFGDDFEYCDISSTEHQFKLVYHPDGFTQFSGTGKILSGRNQDGSGKGFGHLSNPFVSISPGPFIGCSFDGNLSKLKTISMTDSYRILPIFHRGITNKYSIGITDETNMTLELFLRTYESQDPRLIGEIIIHPETGEPLTGIYPHPDEEFFCLSLFEFIHDGISYILGARLLIWEEKEKPQEDFLRYSMGTSGYYLDSQNCIHISCFHGDYWRKELEYKINKSINL